VEQIHDQKGRSIVHHSVIQDRGDPGVADPIAGVALLLKALAHVAAVRVFQMEYLDRDALAVSVRGCVHRSDATDSEHPFEAPLVANELADPGLGLAASFGFVLARDLVAP
jgi:hypothetical protein